MKSEQPEKRRLVLSANLRQAYESSLLGALGAILGLYLYTGFAQASESLSRADSQWWARDVLAGVCLGGSMGFTLAAVGSLRDRAWFRLARSTISGAFAGATGGAIGLLLGELMLARFQGGLVGRSVSWAVLGLGIGASQGIAFRSRQRLIFGVIGGGLGGLVGGFGFEWFREGFGSQYDPTISQGLGITLLGALLGLFLAFVEQVLRRAWVQVVQGRQEGRVFLLTEGRSRIGLDEHAEIGLFGDPAMARSHAEIQTTRAGYSLVNLDTQGRTRVNGEAVASTLILHNGDRIQIGKTFLLFHCKPLASE